MKLKPRNPAKIDVCRDLHTAFCNSRKPRARLLQTTSNGEGGKKKSSSNFDFFSKVFDKQFETRLTREPETVEEDVEKKVETKLQPPSLHDIVRL